MADIKDQLIKDSYNYVLQSDLSTGVVYRIGGDVPVSPIFSSGLTINGDFNYSNGTEQPGYVLTTNGSGSTYWNAVSGSSGISGSGTTGYLPKWSGSTSLVNSLVYDSSTGVTIGTGFTWDNTNGRLGIGTTAPTYKFEVRDTGSTSVTHFLKFRNDNNDYGGITIGSGSGQDLTIQQNTGYGYLATSGFRIGSANGIIWTNNGSIFRIVDPATEATNYLRIANTTGNVLINTGTDSGFKLDVNGNSRIKGAGATSSTNAFIVQNSAGNAALTITNGLTTVVNQDLELGNTVIYWNGGSQIRNISNGVLRLTDSTAADFTRLQFGGGTNSYPSLQRSGSALSIMDASGTSSTNLLIGTTADTGTYKLDVSNPSGYSAIGIQTAVNTNAELQFKNHSYALPRWTIRASSAANGSSGNLVFQRLANTFPMTITSSDNVLIGPTTDAGYKLDVSGNQRNTILFSSTTLTENGLYLANTTEPEIFSNNTAPSIVLEGKQRGGSISFISKARLGFLPTIGGVVGGQFRVDVWNGSSYTNIFNINSDGTSTLPADSNSQIIYVGSATSSIVGPARHRFTTGGPLSGSLGVNTSLVGIVNVYNAPVGAGSEAMLRIFPTINQTGTASGIFRGINVDPTISAITSTNNWRSIEWTNSLGWGLYGSGTSPNYLQGNTLIGKTSDSGQKLQVSGDTLIQGGLTATTISSSTISTSFTSGSVIFQGSGGTLSQNNSNFFWDNTNSRLSLLGGGDNLLNITPQNSGNAIVINSNGYIKWENASLDTYIRGNNGFGVWDNGFNAKFGVNFGSLSFIDTGQNFSFASGNVMIGTITDGGFKLDVNGTARIQGEANVSFLTLAGNTAVNNSGSVMILGASGAWSAVRVPRYFETTGTISASTSIARGTYLNQTLVATANNDVLAAVDIVPTFTTGAFTGVTNLAIRSSGYIAVNPAGGFYGGFVVNSNRSNTYSYNHSFVSHSPNSGVPNQIYAGTRPALPNTSAVEHYVGTDNQIYWNTTNTSYNFLISSTQYLKLFVTTGNLTLQSGGTFTDAGFRLDVVGGTKLRTDTYFGSIAQPSAPTLTTNSTTGGTLAASTYFYRIVAVDFYGNTTTPSNELAVTTTGSTSRVTISWPLVSGAYSYRIYRGTTSGGQNLYYTVAGTNTTSFIDTGAAGTAGTTPTVNLTAYGSYANTSGAFRSGNITIVNNGVGNTSQIVFDKSTDSPAINVVEYESDSTMFEFSLRDNPDGANDFFNWVFPDWQNDSTGWKPLKFSDLTQQFIAQTTNFWSSFLLPSSTPYYTTGPATLSNSPNKFNPFTSTSYNLIKDAGSGTGVFNVDVTGFTGSINRIYWVIIQTGATTFNWGTGSYLNAPIGTGVVITGGWQLLDNGVQIRITGAVLATDRWSFRAFPVPRMGIGTTTPISPLQISTTVAATGAIARGMYLNPTLVAAANNDVLVGLDIAPTFTNGAFTGLKNWVLRLPNGSQIGCGASTTYSFYLAQNETTINAPSGFVGVQIAATNVARFFATTGNFTLQNGGTFTDAGFRLDVFGNSRISGNLTVTGNTSLQSLTATTKTTIGSESDISCALLQMASTTQGVLFPRMTNAQRTSIVSPQPSLMVYCTDSPEGLFIYKSTGWVQII